MTIILFIVQIVLAFMYLMTGGMKAFMQEKARHMMGALEGYPKSFITFIGFAEMAGALGITLPVWLNIYPALTPLAAFGLSIIMLGAMYTHLKRKEWPQLMMAAVFFVALLYLGGSYAGLF